jgi:hypothetical protein
MIPKNQIKGPFLSLVQAEEVIDLAISECNDSTPIYVKLVPIELATIDELVRRYESGEWTVNVGPLRTPNGHAFILS